MGQERASAVMQSILDIKSLSIYSVKEEHVKTAAVLGSMVNLGFNDTIAYLIMQENNIDQIYSFDKDFDSIQELERIH